MSITIDVEGFHTGDSELIEVTFAHHEASLLLMDYPCKSMLRIKLTGVSYVLLESDHLQNIIDSVRIVSPGEIGEDSWLSKFLLDRNVSADLLGGRILYTQPLTGGECVFVFQDLSLEVSAMPQELIERRGYDRP